MKPVSEIRTDRLVLRGWRNEDLEPFARLNADPYVMDDFPARLDRQGSDELVRRLRAHWVEFGFGLWAVEVPGVAPFVGFAGLAEPGFTAPFRPCVEVGWRLAHEFWGQGYATEGARAGLAFAFERLRLDEVISFAASTNLRSLRVMEKLGMRHSSSDDFDHPNFPEGHPLQRQVLYRLSRREWATHQPSH
jgi:RimJ/RimL family protein N-acetyltransferase